MTSPISQSKISLSILLLLGVLLASSASAAKAAIATPTPLSVIHQKAGPQQQVSDTEFERAENYLLGRGVPKDPAQAVYWYRQAAEKGNPDAEVMLACMYEKGLGIDKDTHLAASWDLRAAASGSSEAKVNLASLYLRGDGVKQDAGLALTLLKDAARQNARAEAYLGVMYYIGLGVHADRAQAGSWFKRGAKHHDPQAEYDLALVAFADSSDPRDLKEAASFLGRSSASGYVPALYSLGLLLVNHPELKREPGSEIDMLTTAAEAGLWKSAAVLGILARDGRYVHKDAGASYRWFRIATLQGGPQAESFLKTALDREGKALGENGEAQANQSASAWLAAHPDHRVFAFKNGTDPKYFIFQEVYAASQALDQGRKDEVQN